MELEKQYAFAASRDSPQCRSDALDTLLYNNQTSKLKVYYLEANIKEVTTDSEMSFSCSDHHQNVSNYQTAR